MKDVLKLNPSCSHLFFLKYDTYYLYGKLAGANDGRVPFLKCDRH